MNFWFCKKGPFVYFGHFYVAVFGNIPDLIFVSYICVEVVFALGVYLLRFLACNCFKPFA